MFKKKFKWNVMTSPAFRFDRFVMEEKSNPNESWLKLNVNVDRQLAVVTRSTNQRPFIIIKCLYPISTANGFEFKKLQKIDSIRLIKKD